VRALAHLAERCAIPVITHSPRSVCLPSSHPMHFGFEPGTLVADADLVIVLECDVPWIPHLQHPTVGCRIAHVAEDPFFVRYPMRSFPSDLSIQSGTRNALEAIAATIAVFAIASSRTRIAAMLPPHHPCARNIITVIPMQASEGRS
jgi:acetolactate synthase-1/2/3 large subunit